MPLKRFLMETKSFAGLAERWVGEIDIESRYLCMQDVGGTTGRSACSLLSLIVKRPLFEIGLVGSELSWKEASLDASVRGRHPYKP